MADSSDVLIWATAVSTSAQNGGVIIFRYADVFHKNFNRASQPIRIILVWRYQSSSGQPIPEDHRRMMLLEDTLEAVLAEKGVATLVLVSTGEQLREWTYYAKSEDEFMARLNYALAGMPEFPIEIHSAPDPNWETYQQFKAGGREDIN